MARTHQATTPGLNRNPFIIFLVDLITLSVSLRAAPGISQSPCPGLQLSTGKCLWQQEANDIYQRRRNTLPASVEIAVQSPSSFGIFSVNY